MDMTCKELQTALKELKDAGIDIGCKLNSSKEVLQTCYLNLIRKGLIKDLDGADLIGAYLKGADLSGADLRFSNLIFANLSGADLSNANLSGADLSGADLSNTNLSDSNLRFSDLMNANLSGADLSGADSEGADLKKVKEINKLDIENTFTIRKIYEIANMIAGKTLPPKKKDCLDLIVSKFNTMQEVYQFLIEKEYKEDKYYGVGL